MNEHLANIFASLSDPSLPVAESDVVALEEEYPFFTLPAVMLLRDSGEMIDDATRGRLMERIALNAPDSQALALLSDPSKHEWLDFYPTAQREVTTDSVISTFLNTYGRTSPCEDALIERLIFNPAPEYSSVLAREEEASLPEAVDPADTSQDAVINAYILSQQGESEPQEPAEALSKPAEPLKEHPQTVATEDNSSLTESLAKIYIRQKRFDKAFEIIHTLSLKNPKKSAYFADQLRFLRKLILNRDSANNSK